MTIKQVSGRKPRYFIENEDGGTVAFFDSLDVGNANPGLSVK